MIKVNCETSDTVKLEELVPFQGKLKKRTDQDLTELARSITTEGLMAPFFVWNKDGKKYVLDGHGRLEALSRISMLAPEVLSQDFPCVYIYAESEDEARKSLLQITSSYGKVTKAGIKHFTRTIPEYKAPVVSSFRSVKVKLNKVESDYKVVRLRVLKDDYSKVMDILSTCPCIEVL